MRFDASSPAPIRYSAPEIFISSIHHQVQGHICTCTKIMENGNTCISPFFWRPHRIHHLSVQAKEKGSPQHFGIGLQRLNLLPDAVSFDVTLDENNQIPGESKEGKTTRFRFTHM